MNKSDIRKGLPSASGIEALALCPGKLRMEAGQPDNAGDDAKRGTEVHALLAHEIGEDECKYSESAVIAEGLEEKTRELIEQFAPRDECPDKVREKRLWLRDGIRPIFSGQADLILIDGDRCLIVDYKSGWGEVETSSRNLQLRTLAVLADNEYGGFVETWVAIVQVGHAPKPCVYSAADIREAWTELRGILAAAADENAPLRAGESQCKYCKAIAGCPAAQRELTTTGGYPVESKWEALAPADKLALFESACLAERVAREIKKRARTDLEGDPESIPGLAMKPGSVRKTITHADEAFARLAHEITVPEFTDICTVPIGKLADLWYRKLKAQDSKVTRDFAKSDFLDRLDGIVEEKQTAQTIVKVES